MVGGGMGSDGAMVVGWAVVGWTDVGWTVVGEVVVGRWGMVVGVVVGDVVAGWMVVGWMVVGDVVAGWMVVGVVVMGAVVGWMVVVMVVGWMVVGDVVTGWMVVGGAVGEVVGLVVAEVGADVGQFNPSMVPDVLIVRKANSVGIGLEALRAQQTTLLNTMMQQVNSLNARVEVAEAEAAASAAKAATQGSGTAQSRDAEIEALRQFPYVTLVAGNPSPTRPATLENHMPQTHHLYNDNTYNALCKRTNALMRYERLVLAPALSYLHDSAAHSASAVDSVTDKENAPTMEDLGEGVSAAHNTVKGVLALLNNRYTMIQLRARMESDATVHGGAESVACEAGVHRGEDLTFRAERCWTPCASRGVQRREPTLQEKGVSGAEPGDEQVASCDGLPLVELAPRQVALQDRDSKKLRRLAKPDNWCFSFDLQDGYHVVGINPAFQEYMQFDVWGSCFSAAPFLSGRKSCLIRNEKKGHWEAAQLVEHLGLEVDLKAGQFHVTPARLQNIHVKAKALLSKASGQRRWLPAQRIATFAGLCQSVYLAVPLARLSRRELHYVLFTKRGWSSHGRRGVVAQAASSVPVEQSQDLTKPDESEAAHRLVPLRLGRHFTSRNPELMRRMRLLWILLDLRHRAPSKVHQKRVDRFASELSAQLPRYCAQWHDPGCEGVDSLAFSWLGEVNWVNPPWSLLDEVAHKLREERCSATVVAPYWLGFVMWGDHRKKGKTCQASQAESGLLAPRWGCYMD
ncbi:hypothetical protein CYMTET_38505 [Cymbomonas tetramitiformis]|uniref:Uncharacterized protein n=1 Tax=Cymbomonas tetramitiformis TaxID=36881 RepID=A0AAE0F5E7_9CHLO|nr:hypothetical protein CYMTET_38505 [Cymbomonas tetramitiformis]